MLTQPFTVYPELIGLCVVQMQETPVMLVAFTNSQQTNWTCRSLPVNETLTTTEQAAIIMKEGNVLANEQARSYFSIYKPHLQYTTETL